MSVLNTMPAPIIQMGHVEKLVEVAQNQSHVQQAVSQEEAQKLLKAQSEQIAETDKTAHGRKVRDKREEEGRRHAGSGSDRRQSGKENPEETPEEEGPNKHSPWSGHIVRITI